MAFQLKRDPISGIYEQVEIDDENSEYRNNNIQPENNSILLPQENLAPIEPKRVRKTKRWLK